ncbi:unnamed protein product [Penicillium salamii]|uniref:Uncharacterized protein n=1 Tax=Penicillium salamii TaxID=1612424 RepID=A0A9W4NPG1_9EURO|nr:unnamed protein product [Penicillium salamii]CAG8200705.1 unnamed protein product [Penicillium salamii]CAG8208265.1 unnamed protein product [Penicillium salamii]CAG8229789.1 unnamed protein product [Penicillium salamii]CAG8243978.1 unnamed protein product [Penicillium salamii]
MPRPSSPMGECIGILTSQTDLEITYTSSGCCSSVLHHLFLALDYLHTGTYSYYRRRYIVSVFSDFEEKELQDPSPRKELDGSTIYLSRELRKPKRVLKWMSRFSATLAQLYSATRSTWKTFNLIFIEHRR